MFCSQHTEGAGPLLLSSFCDLVLSDNSHVRRTKKAAAEHRSAAEGKGYFLVFGYGSLTSSSSAKASSSFITAPSALILSKKACASALTVTGTRAEAL